MRIQKMDMREIEMNGKEQERTGKPSEAFYRVEKQLTIQLVPQKGNERLLAAVPHIRWMDLAMVFRIYREEEGCSLSISIRREQLSDWNVTVEEVARKAMEHMPRLLPVKLCGGTGTDSKGAGTHAAEIPGTGGRPEAISPDQPDGVQWGGCDSV